MIRICMLSLASLALAMTSPLLLAGEKADSNVQQKIVVAITADDFELAETDVSHLGIGDAETVVTESGKTIDILRTEQGVEIYVDGELLDAGLDENIEAVHHIDHDVVVLHPGDEEHELEYHVEDVESLELHGEEHGRKVIIIEKHIEDEI